MPGRCGHALLDYVSYYYVVSCKQWRSTGCFDGYLYVSLACQMLIECTYLPRLDVILVLKLSYVYNRPQGHWRHCRVHVAPIGF